jgi:hypothetical protein
MYTSGGYGRLYIAMDGGWTVGGFFKMKKDVFDDLFDNVLEYRLLTLILRNAVYKDEGVMIENIHVKRGQWIRSYRKLAEDLKYKEGRGYKQYSHQAIQKAVKRLEQRGLIKLSIVQLTGRLTDRLTDRLTLIEVVEHQEYQGVTEDSKTDQLTHRLTDQLPDQGTKLRTKELKDINNNNDFNFLNDVELTEVEKLELEIEQYYQTRRDKSGLPLNPKDQDWIRETIKEGFTRNEIIDGINQAFLTAESVNSFEYCLKATRTQKKYREKQRQQQQQQNVIPFNKQQKKQSDSQLPLAFREQKEPELSPEEEAQLLAEIDIMLQEMEQQKGEKTS